MSSSQSPRLEQRFWILRAHQQPVSCAEYRPARMLRFCARSSVLIAPSELMLLRYYPRKARQKHADGGVSSLSR